MIKMLKKVLCIVLFCFMVANVLPMNGFASEMQNHQSKIIVSMGDSYSAGEGITPFLGEYLSIEEMEARGKQGLGEFQDWLAHRSQNAWSSMLTLPRVSGTMADHRNENWFFVASSGAVIDDLYGTQWKAYSKGLDHGAIQQDYQKSYRQFLAPQLSVFDNLRQNGLYADYVTITIGGNDLGFSEMVAQCVASNDCTELQRMIADAKRRFGLKDDENPELIRNKLKQAYKDIFTAAGEQAHVIVVGYPILFDVNGGDVLVDIAENFDNVFLKITPAEASIIKDAALWFDTELKAVVEECGLENIHYVSVVEAFRDHAAYSERPFLNEVMPVQSEDIVDFISKPNETITGWPPKTHYERPTMSDILDPITSTIASAFSIHPNLQGAEAYARCVQAKIDEIVNNATVDKSTQTLPITAPISFENIHMQAGRRCHLTLNPDGSFFCRYNGWSSPFAYTIEYAGSFVDIFKKSDYVYSFNLKDINIISSQNVPDYLTLSEAGISFGNAFELYMPGFETRGTAVQAAKQTYHSGQSFGAAIDQLGQKIDVGGSLAVSEYILLDSDKSSVFLAADDSSINPHPSDEENLLQVPYQVLDSSSGENLETSGESLHATYTSVVSAQNGSRTAHKFYALEAGANQKTIYSKQFNLSEEEQRIVDIYFEEINHPSSTSLHLQVEVQDGYSYSTKFTIMSPEMKNKCYIVVHKDYIVVIEKSERTSGWYSGQLYLSYDPFSNHSALNDNWYYTEKVTVYDISHHATEILRIEREMRHDPSTKVSEIRFGGDSWLYVSGFSSYTSSRSSFLSTEQEFCDMANNLVLQYLGDTIYFMNTTWDNRWYQLEVNENGIPNDMFKIDTTCSYGILSSEDTVSSNIEFIFNAIEAGDDQVYTKRSR